MKSNSATAAQPVKEAHVNMLPASDLSDRSKEVSDSIARRAFEMFEGRGHVDGHDLEDWFRAESELLHPTHLKIAESDDTVTIDAEVPGFSAKDLDVSVEPGRLTISGTRETHKKHTTQQTIYREQCSNQIYRVIDLPADADSSKVTTTLKDGVLEFVMPRIAEAPKVEAEKEGA